MAHCEYCGEPKVEVMECIACPSQAALRARVAELEADVERWKFDADTTRLAHVGTHARMLNLQYSAQILIDRIYWDADLGFITCETDYNRLVAALRGTKEKP